MRRLLRRWIQECDREARRWMPDTLKMQQGPGATQKCWEREAGTQQESDPSYPGGITTQDTSDPEVLRAETTPILLPGDGRQRQPFHTVTWIQKEEQDGAEAGNAGTRVQTLGEAADRGGNHDVDGGVPDNGRGENSVEDLGSRARTAGQHRGT
ncbi:hypothetical protein NDU88_001859 [Pleurodeles waltl]|uniref:Uncharacterized protein n=1 Tax=Pleurodeles waltl TaxID=8319 RepID=A0AAV7UVE6_PLEWA|nr:hypothetical protein NDU88_001859 [Pleurodeles waltl]